MSLRRQDIQETFGFISAEIFYGLNNQLMINRGKKRTRMERTVCRSPKTRRKTDLAL